MKIVEYSGIVRSMVGPCSLAERRPYARSVPAASRNMERELGDIIAKLFV